MHYPVEINKRSLFFFKQKYMLKTKNTYIKHNRKNYKAKYINLARAESEALDDIMVCSNKI